MKNYIVTTLGAVCQTISATYKGAHEEVILINTSDVFEGDILNHTKVKNEKLPGQFKKTFQPKDILYSEIRPANKHFAFVDIADTKQYIASTKLMVIRAKTEQILPEFLYILLTSPRQLIEFQQAAETRSGTFPQITFQSEVAPTKIILPDIKTQEKIVCCIKIFSEKMKNLSQINHNLEEQAKAIFKSWFVDFEPFDFNAPDKWQHGSLGEFVEIKRGGSPRPIQDYLSNAGLRWLKISDATACSSPFLIDIKEHIKESGLSKTVLLHAGALVLSNSATPGIPKILDVDSCIHDGWLYFPKSKLSNEFLFLFFKHIRPNLVSLGNGSVFTNLKTDILKAYPFILPDEQTLSAFNNVVVPIFEKIKNNSREINSLSQLRDTLLPKLMSGEIDVSEMEI